MAAKGRDASGWKHGRGAGWTEFRYGDATLHPATLAGRKRQPAPLFSGERKKAAIQRTMDFLRDWRQSPFEQEAAVRAGLRSGLCLAGYPWERSDAAAIEIVS